MGKIGKWEKMGTSHWVLDGGKQANIYCYVVRTESFKKLYNRKVYHGQVELRGILVAGSPAYSSQAKAEAWCKRWMKAHPKG